MTEITDRQLFDSIEVIEGMVQSQDEQAKAFLDANGVKSEPGGNLVFYIISEARFGENVLQLTIPFSNNKPKGFFGIRMHIPSMLKEPKTIPARDLAEALEEFAKGMRVFTSKFGEPTETSAVR